MARSIDALFSSTLHFSEMFSSDWGNVYKPAAEINTALVRCVSEHIDQLIAQMCSRGKRQHCWDVVGAEGLYHFGAGERGVVGGGTVCDNWGGLKARAGHVRNAKVTPK